jgi:hypothetical protein
MARSIELDVERKGRSGDAIVIGELGSAMKSVCDVAK